MILHLSLLLLLVYIIGIFLTLILYKFDFFALFTAELGKKILMWIPITIIFLFFALANKQIMLFGFFLLLIGMYYEQIKIIKSKHVFPSFIFWSVIPFTLAFGSIGLIIKEQTQATEILIILAVSASLSDVGAFFFGKFFGFHKLPQQINKQKAWEGVCGQLVGAFIGIVLLKLYIFPSISLLWFLPIGLGSACGDLYNSFLKRKLSIATWSSLLPGHGGLSDRFISLAVSALFFLLFVL